jgi:hypothetical protein
MKDVQATGEAFNPQKRTSSTSKHDIFKTIFLVSIFVGHFCPLGIPNHIPNAIRIQPTKTSADPYYSKVFFRFGGHMPLFFPFYFFIYDTRWVQKQMRLLQYLSPETFSEETS